MKLFLERNAFIVLFSTNSVIFKSKRWFQEIMWFSKICKRVTDPTFGVLLFSRVHNFQEIAFVSKLIVKNNIIFETSIISWKLCGCFEITTPMLLDLNPYLLTPLLMSSYLLGFVNRNANMRTCNLMLNAPSHMSWMSLTKFQSQLAKMDSRFLHFLAIKTLNISYLCFSSLFHSFPQPQ